MDITIRNVTESMLTPKWEKYLYKKYPIAIRKQKKKNPVPNINIFTPLYIIILSVYIVLLQCIVYKMEEMMKHKYTQLLLLTYPMLGQKSDNKQYEYYVEPW